MVPSHHIVIIGGGFGGLYAARALKRAPARVTLVDRRNFHLFQPLLYQVATGALSPANIAVPLRGLLHRQQNTSVVMAEVVDIDVKQRRLVLREGGQLDLQYDTLIVASGSKFNYFGHDQWSELAPGLKTVEDALTIRRRVLSAFEKAELETDPREQRACMTFIVVGAGPTGVEMAGALGEVAHHTLRRDFRNVRPADATILLLEAQDCVLGQFPPDLQHKAEKSLERLGVTVRLGATVTQISPQGVTVKTGDRTETIAAGAVLWTAGVKASALGAALAQATGLVTDRLGRLAVEPDLSLPGHPEIFVIGDLASFSHQTPQPLPGLAPVAMQEGRYVAKVVRRRLAGKLPPKAFRYFDRGNMATIGRAAAVADLGWLHISGYLAWLTWLFIHLLYLVQFQNRVLVLIQWAYSYLTRGRAARLITQEPPRIET
ncbi:MAG: NAD(P)/FAD-dependent oxidoreductase [Planctomycetia bacterium]|nr:NAD(P)/FAD-dependent oxidoreductase [Planctomycetia bacterium]